MPAINFEVIKEPKGFIRSLQLVFAIIAFSTLANFSTEIVFNVLCKNPDKPQEPDNNQFHSFSRSVVYPFKNVEPISFDDKSVCGIDNIPALHFSGDVSSDAQFFVFTGVVSFLYSAASLLVYLRVITMSSLVDTKKEAMVDFMISALLGMFWLAGSAAWANGLTQLKWVCNTNNWLFSRSICQLTSHTPPTYHYTKVFNCSGSAGVFTGANSSVLLGFLNFFLWTANLWFLYKETAWFRGSKGVTMRASELGDVETVAEDEDVGEPVVD